MIRDSWLLALLLQLSHRDTTFVREASLLRVFIIGPRHVWEASDLMSVWPRMRWSSTQALSIWSLDYCSIMNSSGWVLLSIYSTRKADSIIRFCCDSLFFISFACTSRSLVLLFFRVNVLSAAEILSVFTHCPRLSCETCFHLFVFFIFRSDFVMTRDEVESLATKTKSRSAGNIRSMNFLKSESQIEISLTVWFGFWFVQSDLTSLIIFFNPTRDLQDRSGCQEPYLVVELWLHASYTVFL